MCSATVSFRDSLATTVKALTLDESKWKSEDWKPTWNGINQEVLNDAFNQHGIVRTLFSDLGEITQRNCKSIARVEKKMTEQSTGRENYFKVVSDFVAVRVPCEVTEIQGKIDRIREIVLANGGIMHVRGSSNERPYGFFMTPEKKYADITQYVYVFLDKVGYPLELQIGHKFASHTFTIDSALRDNPTCGKVDLWKNNFYGDVKKHILDKANGEQVASKEALITKAKDLHQGNIPEDLAQILSKI
jgi:hypothetical protein